MLGVADLIVLDDAVGLEEAIPGVLVVRLVDGLREYYVAKVSDREVTAWGGKKSNSQLKLKTRRRKTENTTRDGGKDVKKTYRRKPYFP